MTPYHLWSQYKHTITKNPVCVHIYILQGIWNKPISCIYLHTVVSVMEILQAGLDIKLCNCNDTCNDIIYLMT